MSHFVRGKISSYGREVRHRPSWPEGRFADLSEIRASHAQDRLLALDARSQAQPMLVSIRLQRGGADAFRDLDDVGLVHKVRLGIFGRF